MKNGLQSAMLSAYTRKANQAEICKQLSFFLFNKFLTTLTYVCVEFESYDAINKMNR